MGDRGYGTFLLFKQSATVLDIKREVSKELMRRAWNGYGSAREDFPNTGIEMLYHVETYLMEFKDLKFGAISELFHRYSVDVLKSTLWFFRVRDFYNVSKELFDQMVHWNYSKEQLESIFMQAFLSVVTLTELSNLDLTKILSHEEIDYLMEEYLDDFYCPCYEGSEIVREIVRERYPACRQFLKELTKSPIELLQDYLDCHYLYHTNELCNQIFVEVLLGLSSCTAGFGFR